MFRVLGFRVLGFRVSGSECYEDYEDVGSSQNWDPILVPLNKKCRTITYNQKGQLISRGCLLGIMQGCSSGLVSMCAT